MAPVGQAGPLHDRAGRLLAGFGIMCAGAPGAAHFFGLASPALGKLF